MKIGSTNRPNGRLRAYNTSCPHRAFRYAFVRKVVCRKDAEDYLHRVFSTKRLPNSEWFAVPADRVREQLDYYEDLLCGHN